MTAEHDDRVRNVTVRGITARVSVRPGVGSFTDEPPLLLCNGIGISFEALQPLVDQLHPDRGIVRFDVPGVGGSAVPPLPYPIAGLASWVHRTDGAAGAPALRRPRPLLGWRPRPAARGAGAKARTPGGAGRHRHRQPDGAGVPEGAGRSCRRRDAPRPGVRRAGRPADFYGGSMRTDPGLGAALAARRHPLGSPSAATTTSWRPWSAGPSLPFLGLLRQPTLVMGGDDDPIIPVANPKMQAV